MLAYLFIWFCWVILVYNEVSSDIIFDMNMGECTVYISTGYTMYQAKCSLLTVMLEYMFLQWSYVAMCWFSNYSQHTLLSSMNGYEILIQ